MAQLNIEQSQFRTAKQRIQNKYIKIELLNKSFQVVDNLEGLCIDGSISIDANSDMRRSGSVELVVKKTSFDVQAGGRIFIDKYLRIQVGIYSIAENRVVYTNCGIFIIDAPSYRYEASSDTLNLSLLDLMANLSGTRNGYLEGIPTRIEANESIRNAMIATLALGGVTNYVIADTGLLPISLDFPQGSTIYTILSGLRDIYPNYEIYFDVDGVFHYEQIPTGENEMPQVDDSLWENIVIDESVDTDFQSVKNSIEVYGRTHDPAHYSAETTIDNDSQINLSIADVSAYVDGIIYGFLAPSDITLTNPTLKINNLEVYKLQEDGADITTLVLSQDEYLCVRWSDENKVWEYLGHLQAYAIAEDNNEDSPFYIGSVGKIRLPLYGGEYDNIFTDNLAKQRAEYELWKRTQLQSTIQLSCVTVEWLDVNILVNYTRQKEKEAKSWIIKSISYGLDPSSSMSVQLTRFYPNYFYI